MEWLDWIREVERNRHMLERIVALLFSLAGLADRASGLPTPTRLKVLGFLGHGEAEARAFVIGMAHESGAPADEADAEIFMAAGDAERLAVSFRVLALVLGAMLAQARRFSRWFRRDADPVASPTMPMRKPAELEGSRRASGRRLHHHARGPPPDEPCDAFVLRTCRERGERQRPAA